MQTRRIMVVTSLECCSITRSDPRLLSDWGRLGASLIFTANLTHSKATNIRNWLVGDAWSEDSPTQGVGAKRANHVGREMVVAPSESLATTTTKRTTRSTTATVPAAGHARRTAVSMPTRTDSVECRQDGTSKLNAEAATHKVAETIRLVFCEVKS